MSKQFTQIQLDPKIVYLYQQTLINQKLVDAVIKEDLELVKTIYNTQHPYNLSPDVSSQNSSLKYAANSGLLEIFKYLLTSNDIKIKPSVKKLDQSQIQKNIKMWLKTYKTVKQESNALKKQVTVQVEKKKLVL